MKKLPQPIVVTKPTGLILTNGINPGELRVRIAGMKKVSLIIEYTVDPMTPDSQCESITCSNCSYSLTGLAPGKRYWIRDRLVQMFHFITGNSVYPLEVHNHLINETPAIKYIHYHGEGNAVELAQKIKQCCK